MALRQRQPWAFETAYNKIYLLRSLRCRGSSGARPYAPKMPSSHKRDVCLVLLGQALRAHLVTQAGFTDRINDTSVTKRQVNSALCEMPMKNTQAKILFRSSLLAALCIIQHIYGHDPGSLVIQGDIQTGYVNPEKVEFKKVSVDLKCQVMSSPGALVVLAGGQKFTDIHIAQNRVSFALSTKSFNKHNMPKPLASDFLKSFKGNYSRDVGITALSLKCEKFRGGFAAGTRDKAIALIYTDGPLKLKGEWTTPRNKVYIVDANFEGKGFHALELSRENEKWYLRPLPRKKSPSITVQIILDM